MQNRGWQTFAQNNNLTFKSEILLFRDAYVIGNYDHYKFKLETFSRTKQIETPSRWRTGHSPSRIYTRMILQTIAPVTINTINRAFDKTTIIDWLLLADMQEDIKGRFYAYETGQQLVYEQEYIEVDPSYLQTVVSLLKGLIEKYPYVIELGAEAISVLHPVSRKYHILRHVAGQLIFDIGQKTEQELKKRASYLLCPHCLVHCGTHQINVPWIGDIKYYGCRVCSQSRNLVNSENYRLIVELDRGLLREQRNQGTTIWINWIRHPKLFDFEAVEIIRASDEEVERFVVQVGNDTDPTRRGRYKQMECKVSSGCGLSENTMRILQRTFGSVEMV